MSRPKLATYVHVADKHDQMHVFGPDNPPPDWAIPKITNPKAWAGGKVPGTIESRDDERARLLARLAELDETGDNPGSDGEDGKREGDDAPPPKSGPGSGAPKWREYAASHQVDVPADASRETVIAALDEAGVRTE